MCLSARVNISYLSVVLEDVPMARVDYRAEAASWGSNILLHGDVVQAPRRSPYLGPTIMPLLTSVTLALALYQSVSWDQIANGSNHGHRPCCIRDTACDI